MCGWQIFLMFLSGCGFGFAICSFWNAKKFTYFANEFEKCAHVIADLKSDIAKLEREKNGSP